MKMIITITGLNTLIFILVLGNILFSSDNTGSKLPIVYSDNYDITLYGIEKLHPFETQKYSKVYDYLVEEVGILKTSFFSPEMVSKEDLLKVHTQEYLDSLKNSETVARIAELGMLSIFPGKALYKNLLVPMKYATGGTILSLDLALKYGWAVNLSGGYHHAKAGSGEGFCYFSDIAIAVKRILEKNPNISIMIVDLDAHQGNGFESIFKNQVRIYIFDIYNEDIYPHDYEAKKYIDFDHPVETGIKDKEYLSLLEKKLPQAINKCKPGIIIYNAGTDIYEEDNLGGMKITMQGIIKRDEIVFNNAVKRKIPIAMVLSGGYTKESSVIISKSIENLINKLKLNK